MLFEKVGQRPEIHVCHEHILLSLMTFLYVCSPGGEDEAEDQAQVLTPSPCITSPVLDIANPQLLGSEGLTLPSQPSAGEPP